MTIASFSINVDPATKKADPTTKKPAKTFHDGDDMVIEVKNQGAKDAYIELIGLSAEGRMIVPQPPILLGPGKTYHYPHDRPVKPADFVEMALPPGVDRYLLFAADIPFPAGVRFRRPLMSRSPTAWCIPSGKSRRTERRPSCSTRRTSSRRRWPSRRAKDSSKTKLPFSRDPKGSRGDHAPPLRVAAKRPYVRLR